MQSQNLQPVPTLVDKIVQLYLAMHHRKAVVLLGGPQTGKSTCCIRSNKEFSNYIEKVELFN